MSATQNTINPENTTIVVIEFQKTWTEKGIFHWLIKNEYRSRNVFENTTNLLEHARKKGLQVIQAPLILDREDREKYRQIPFPPKLLKRFTKNTWKAEFTEGIYNKNDSIVSGRCGFDACEGSDLEQILSESKKRHVLFCGFTTDHCVEMTMNTLESKGYQCVLVSDCTATRNHNTQKKVEKRHRTLTSEEVIRVIDAHR